MLVGTVFITTVYAKSPEQNFHVRLPRNIGLCFFVSNEKAIICIKDLNIYFDSYT